MCWYSSGYWTNSANISCVDRTDPVGPGMKHTRLGLSLFPGTTAISIIHGISELPLGKDWIQCDGIVLHIGPMGPIFLVLIGQTLWVLKCTLHDWDTGFSWYSSSLNHSSHNRPTFGSGLESRWWYISGYRTDRSNISFVDMTSHVGLGNVPMLLGHSFFPGTVAHCIIHGTSDLPLGRGWIQGDGIVLDIRSMGSIILMWIGQTLRVLECPVRDWNTAIFLVQYIFQSLIAYQACLCVRAGFKVMV